MDVSTLSLIVAVLAVVVGPCVALTIARRQIRASLVATNKQITAPMRQAWINKLRELLVELTSSAEHYYVAGYEDRTDKEYQRVTLLQAHIRLMLNPNEEDHQHLERLMRRMVTEIEKGKSDVFPVLLIEVIDLSRKILKREWDRVKNPIDARSVKFWERFLAVWTGRKGT